MSLIYINPYSFSVPWTPANITTALWFDAADTSTITTSSNLVDQWNDKSGNGRNLTQILTDRPTYNATGQNNLGTIEFNGAGTRLDRNQTYLSSTWTCVIAGKNFNTATGGQMYVAQGSDTNETPRWQFGRNASGLARMLQRNDAGTISGISGDAHAVSAFIQSGTNDGSFLGVSLNGAALSTNTAVTGTFSTNKLSIGALYSGTATVTSPWDGAVFEVVYAPTMLSTLDRQKVEGYLAHKWALTSVLPANHPYKTTAPTT
jgi:hypothetical protein